MSDPEMKGGVMTFKDGCSTMRNLLTRRKHVQRSCYSRGSWTFRASTRTAGCASRCALTQTSCFDHTLITDHEIEIECDTHEIIFSHGDEAVPRLWIPRCCSGRSARFGVSALRNILQLSSPMIKYHQIPSSLMLIFAGWGWGQERMNIYVLSSTILSAGWHVHEAML